MDTNTFLLLAILALGIIFGLGCRRSHRSSHFADPLYISIFTAMDAVRQGKHRGGTESV